jgi:hypothetical protein
VRRLLANQRCPRRSGPLRCQPGVPGQKLGRILSMDALFRSWKNTTEVASVGVVAEAYNESVRDFYLHGSSYLTVTNATASTSISHSGRTSLRTMTNVLTGGVSRFTKPSRTLLTAESWISGSTVSTQ